MTKILICGIAELDEMLENNNVSTIISICDPVNPGSDLQHAQFKERLELNAITHSFYFKDYRKRNPVGVGNDGKRAIPSIEDVIRMKELTPLLKNQEVLFHCTEGISRSTAFAYIVLRETGSSAAESFAKLREIRCISRPNSRITDIYENLLSE
jgi:predicted protein tyrosine phosphatase